MYVCVYLSMYGLCHTNEIEGTILTYNEITRSKSTLLKVNQGDLSWSYAIWTKRLLTEKLGSFLSIVRRKYVFCL